MKQLQAAVIQENISLADKNWFQTGGMARYFAEPRTYEQMVDVLEWADKQHFPLVLLGRGANILIADNGFDGLVIRPNITSISYQDLSDEIAYVTAGAGVGLDQLIHYCFEHALQGLEEFSGIPGTVGGAVFINLHYFEFLLSQFLVQAEVIEIATGTIKQVDSAWFAFGYNRSRLHEKKHVLLSATFIVRKKDTETIAYAKGRSVEIIRHRNKRYPQQATCGSFFRNFYEDEVMLESQGKKIIWVAYYLDKIGVKGVLQVGDARVSYQHANMIVNYGRAKSIDIIAVARHMQERVYKEFGVIPQEECQLVGFQEYPLLPAGKNDK